MEEKNTIFILTEEYSNEEEITYSFFPCKDLKSAKKLMEERKNKFLSEMKTFGKAEDCCALSETPTSYYNSFSDNDYYIFLDIDNKEIYSV